MKLVFEGTKGDVEESSPLHRKHSSLLIEYKATRLVIDWGENHTVDELERLKPGFILFTHAHRDHYDEEALGRFILSSYVAKEATGGKYQFSSLVNVFEGRKAFQDLSVEPIPVGHSINAPTVGYLVQGDKRLWYCPDFLFLRKELQNKLLNLDVFIGDGSSIKRSILRRRDSQIFGHASMEVQKSLAERLGAKKIIFTHAGKEVVEAGLKSFDACLVAFDGLELAL